VHISVHDVIRTAAQACLSFNGIMQRYLPHTTIGLENKLFSLLRHLPCWCVRVVTMFKKQFRFWRSWLSLNHLRQTRSQRRPPRSSSFCSLEAASKRLRGYHFIISFFIFIFIMPSLSSTRRLIIEVSPCPMRMLRSELKLSYTTRTTRTMRTLESDH
jgi:hypothetical protein